jgi:hypothetical protein
LQVDLRTPCQLKAQGWQSFTPCLWQYASINFLKAVVFLILKKTSSPSYHAVKGGKNIA